MIHDYSSSGHLEEKLVSIDVELMRRLIQQGEMVLGIEHKDREFSLVRTDGVSDRLPKDASYSDGEFEMGFIMEDSVVFHEAIHFLMDQEGLLFGQTVSWEENGPLFFYGSLIDETIAILATSRIYPIDRRLPCLNLREYKSQLNAYFDGERKKAKKVSKERRESFERSVEDFWRSMVVPLEFVQKHLEIESDFLSAGNMQKAVEKALEFYSGLGDMRLAFIIKGNLSMANAYAMSLKNVAAVKLYSALTESACRGEKRYVEMYFHEIVGNK